MRAICRQAKADLLSRRAQSALILLTLAAATTLITTGLVAANSVRMPFERAFAAANGAHLWIYLSNEGAGAAGADAAGDANQQRASLLAALPGVEASTGLRQVLYGTLFLGSAHEYISLAALGPELPAVSRPIVLAGRYFSPGDGAAILLDHNLARSRGLKVGDSVDILTQAGRRPLAIVGLVLNVDSPPYPNSRPALNYVPEAVFAELADGNPVWGWVGLRLRDPHSVGSAWQAARASLGKTASGSTDWMIVRDSFDAIQRVTSVFLAAFGFFALISSGFIIMATISGTVLAQYRTIGLLKAVGFTGRQVAGLFVFTYALLAAPGALIGAAAGLALAPLALHPISAALNSPPQPVVTPGLLIVVLAGVPALAALFSLGPAWRASQVNAVQAIRMGSENPRIGASRLAGWAARRGLPPVIALGLKDIFAHRLRAALLAGSVGVTVLGVMFSLGLNATIDAFVNDPELRGVEYQVWFGRERLTDAAARQALAARPEIEAYYGESWAALDLLGPDGAPLGPLYGRFEDSGFAAFPFQITAGRKFAAPGEVVAGEGLLRLYGKLIGDYLPVELDGHAFILRITGSYTELGQGGRMVIGSLDTLQQAAPDAAPRQYYARVRPGADLNTLVQAVEASTGSQLLGEAVDTTPPDEVLRLRTVVGSLSVILALVALVSVFNAALMASRERFRDFGIFKAIGFTPAQVAGVVLVGTGSLALAATLIGLPLGLWGTYAVLHSLAPRFGFTQSIPLAVNWPAVACVPPGAMLIAAAGSALPARWAARLMVAEALRYE